MSVPANTIYHFDQSTEKTTKWVYAFEEGNAGMRDLLGGKGANLAEMTNIGLPVPPGFTITTAACLAYLAKGEVAPANMMDQTIKAMADLGKKMGRTFGNNADPLLVSVRSGSKFSMPGMMDTILNLGLNDEAVLALAAKSDPRFAWDAYRRFVQMFGKVVMDVEGHHFEHIITQIRESEGVASDPEVSAEGWQKAVKEFKALIKKETGTDFPLDPWKQLELAIEAVFRSWNGKRAVDYRNHTNIAHDLGTAVNVVAMVFGNMGWDSGSGVAFTRNPSTGENVLYGEFLFNAQGEDVVSGSRTPIPIAKLQDEQPEIYRQFHDIAQTLEKHYRDMQDVEFTVEQNRLWMLQCRNGKRTAAAEVKIAVDQVTEGLISKDEAVARIEPAQIDQLLHPRFDDDAKKAAKLLAKGLNASPGAAVGTVTFDADTAEQLGKVEGKAVILVRPETTPDDVHGMLAAKGILTQHGGATSHAAVVARQLGLPCVAGCEDIRIDLKARQFSVNGVVVKEGDVVSLDGARGEVFLGAVKTIAPSFDDQPDLKTILGWADSVRRLQVWANADDPDQARRARSYGAQGIGLCRTEHMFLGDRTEKFQEAILAETEEEFNRVLDEVLLPLQRNDFYGIFKEMDGLPVIIRLLDPPLHEFLPSRESLIEEVATLKAKDGDSKLLAEKEALLHVVNLEHEFNPMLGLRGCRLGIMRPALNRMQVRAIFEAACDAAREGVDVHPEVMIPLTSHINELKEIQPLLLETARAVMEEKGVTIKYKFGTMIEIPRAALTAAEIASMAEFFSFGTNDLTQMTYGISRDDAERKFLLNYVERGILPKNPFQTIDQTGVGRLMEFAVSEGRAARGDLEVGICGEHGGDPASVEFCHKIGLNYVSCSPYRVPIARLAAAQAVIRERKAKK
ncbi:MAG: pyruvate, phosphate dikinase [Anaerolineae bacterium]|nr:pyruvate, phosphate dikinase [Anaerolineae bacterium]